MHFTFLALAALAMAALQQSSVTPGEFDYAKVDRKIASQPKFVAEARYALLLLGDGKTRLWMAMDKSAADAAEYDVVYVDRDADGNLGEEGERFAAKNVEDRGLVFEIGKVELKDSKTVLSDFQITTYIKETPSFTYLSFRMNDKVTLYGGQGPNHTYLQFAKTPDKAPILHADPWGTLSFFHAGPEQMTIGQSDTFMVYVGAKGSGPATFMALDEHFLDLDKDKLFATVIARDQKGNEVRKRSPLKEHC